MDMSNFLHGCLLTMYEVMNHVEIYEIYFCWCEPFA
jgi:hypothetical protein